MPKVNPFFCMGYKKSLPIGRLLSYRYSHSGAPAYNTSGFFLSAKQAAEELFDAAHVLGALYCLAAVRHIGILPFRAVKCSAVHHVIIH